VSLAGFAFDDCFEGEFNAGWNAALSRDALRPKAPYLHMKEMRQKSGIFGHGAGWNDDKRAKLIMDLLYFMRTLDKKRFRMFGCSIDLRAHREAIASGAVLASPIKICNHFVPQLALAWYIQEFPGVISWAHYYFDANEPFRHCFEQLWLKKKRDRLDHTANREAFQLIKSVGVVDAKDNPAMQAADLLAWALNRNLTAEEGDFMKHLAHVVTQIIPNYTAYFSTGSLKELRVPL
jgi:hypothetical protein